MSCNKGNDVMDYKPAAVFPGGLADGLAWDAAVGALVCCQNAARWTITYVINMHSYNMGKMYC